MPSYFDAIMKQIMGGMNGPNAQVEAGMIASGAEDDALREQLGSKRKRRKGEAGGSYLLAGYPGFEHEIWKAEHGFAPLGQSSYKFFGEDLQQRRQREEEQKKWAGIQRQLLGMPEQKYGTSMRGDR